MEVVGLNNGSIMRVVMKPNLFVAFLDSLTSNYDNFIVAGVTDFLGIDKKITKERFDSFKEAIKASNKPVWFEINTESRYLYGNKVDYDIQKTARIYMSIIKTIVDGIVYNDKKLYGDFSSDDFEIITPNSKSGSSFYMDMFFDLGRC